MWTLCAILTETDTFPVDSPARTVNLTARLAEADWFYFPYPGLSRIAKGIFVDPMMFYQLRVQIQFKITNYYEHISMDFELLRQFQIIYRLSSALYIAHVINDNYYHV